LKETIPKNVEMGLMKMGIRITIMLDDDNSKKLRVLQAKKLKESNKSISFSRVLNDVLRKGL